jgi:hypothetical protein
MRVLPRYDHRPKTTWLKYITGWTGCNLLLITTLTVTSLSTSSSSTSTSSTQVEGQGKEENSRRMGTGAEE